MRLRRKRSRGDTMRLYTRDPNNQFSYLGDYDIVPSGNGQNANRGGQAEKRGLLDNERNRFYLRRYGKTIWGMLIGFIIGILFLAIGFFQTLLLAILMAIGFLIGGFFDRNPVVMRFINNLG